MRGGVGAQSRLRNLESVSSGFLRKMFKRRMAMFELAIEVLKLAAEHVSSTADHQTKGFVFFYNKA